MRRLRDRDHTGHGHAVGGAVDRHLPVVLVRHPRTDRELIEGRVEVVRRRLGAATSMAGPPVVAA
ncbi:MAG TPA: hypothetical protein VLT32_12100, partial [Candidatus Sulfomarinibacteraceae bacterium]|nr:hypothetical protein [Candidatus Sulfomarinibacteraceae bacterium]